MLSAYGREVVVAGLLALAEAMLGVGIVLPGEVMITGIAASAGTGGRYALIIAVTAGATAGDHINYWLGRSNGDCLGKSRLMQRIGHQHWERAESLIRRHGAWALVISRLLPVVRTLMAAAAGVAGLGYRRFAAASLTGSTLWAVAWVSAGDVVRAVLDQTWALFVALVVATAVATTALARRRA